jgi:hypothetical protein
MGNSLGYRDFELEFKRQAGLQAGFHQGSLLVPPILPQKTIFALGETFGLR